MTKIRDLIRKQNEVFTFDISTGETNDHAHQLRGTANAATGALASVRVLETNEHGHAGPPRLSIEGDFLVGETGEDIPTNGSNGNGHLHSIRISIPDMPEVDASRVLAFLSEEDQKKFVKIRQRDQSGPSWFDKAVSGTGQEKVEKKLPGLLETEKIFSGPNDSKLPDRVQRMPIRLRRIFTSTFNSVFSRCREERQSVTACDQRAFSIANAAVNRAMEKSFDYEPFDMVEFIEEMEKIYDELVAENKQGKEDLYAIYRSAHRPEDRRRRRRTRRSNS